MENIKPILSGILGLCVGDALGVPYEFKSRTDMKFKPAKDMTGYGSHLQPAGTWSDDSSLTFCLMDSLCSKFSMRDIGNHFCDWFYKQKWTPHGKVFDIGVTTRMAIKNIMNGANPEFAGKDTEDSNGNGSLMRILPLAYYLYDYEGDKFEIIEKVSSITHRHIRSKIACSIYIEYAMNILKGYSKKSAYKEMQKTILDYYSPKVNAEELSHFDRILKDKIYRFSESKIYSSGYVIHTLEASLWSFIRGRSYEKAVLKAINLGEDTDTTGAVTGGLAGIYFGYDNIPSEWLDQIARKDDIIELCTRFNEVRMKI